MQIKSLYLKDFRGYPEAEITFHEFTCLFGQNGSGKTTILDAISLLCSSLDFSGQEADSAPGGFITSSTAFSPTVSAKARMHGYLKKNIRNVETPEQAPGFLLSGKFEHEGKTHEAILNQEGFLKNEVTSHSVWWPGMVYFAKFDLSMVNFQLREDQWSKFKESYEEVTGYTVEPEIHVVAELEKKGLPSRIVTGFFLKKPTGTIYCRKCSAGEQKLAKAFSSILNLEDSRRPLIVLVDEIEKHVYSKRHLTMIKLCKKLFDGMQLIATTHSTPVIETYEPKDHLINVEQLFMKQETPNELN